MGNDAVGIRSMVESMTETGGMSGGCNMCIGNHIPLNVPPEVPKRGQDLFGELVHRRLRFHRTDQVDRSA